MNAEGKGGDLVRRRGEILGNMTEGTRTIAKEMEELNQRASRNVLKATHEMGRLVAEVVSDEGKYGARAVEQLSAYTGVSSVRLYAYQALAKAYEWEQLKAESEVPRADGSPLEAGHFMALARIHSADKRSKLLKQVRQECTSVNELEVEIRAAGLASVKRQGGGRKPSEPKSIIAGLQAVQTRAYALSNYLVAVGDSVLSRLEEADEPSITDATLRRLDEAETQLSTVRDKTDAALVGLAKVRPRVEKIVARKAREASEAAADADGKAAKKKAAKASGKKVVKAAGKKAVKAPKVAAAGKKAVKKAGKKAVKKAGKKVVKKTADLRPQPA